MWSTDDAPVLKLWLQRCVGVIVADNTRGTKSDVGHSVYDVSGAIAQATVCTAAVCDVVHPWTRGIRKVVPVGLDETLVLAWIPIIASRIVSAFGWVERWHILSAV